MNNLPWNDRLEEAAEQAVADLMADSNEDVTEAVRAFHMGEVTFESEEVKDMVEAILIEYFHTQHLS